MEIKYHNIIDKPWEYRIIKFNYCSESEDWTEHTLEVWLKKENEIRKLRFIGPSQLKIEEGFPYPTRGMEIIDLSESQIENITISVIDVEATHGAVRFYAGHVEEIK